MWAWSMSVDVVLLRVHVEVHPSNCMARKAKCFDYAKGRAESMILCGPCTSSSVEDYVCFPINGPPTCCFVLVVSGILGVCGLQATFPTLFLFPSFQHRAPKWVCTCHIEVCMYGSVQFRGCEPWDTHTPPPRPP